MNNETTVGYKEFINVIKRGKWVILLLTLVLTLIATAFSFYLMKSAKPIYQTKIGVIIGEKEDIVNAKGLISTFEEIASSSTIAKNTSKTLKGSVSTLEVQKNYEVSVTDGAPILTITASGKSQKESVAIANAVYISFTNEVKRIYPTQIMKIMENYAQNGVVNNKFKFLNVILAFLLGLFLSIFIVTFKGYFDEKIRTKEDVERYLGLEVIGNLPKRKETDI